MGQGLAGLKSAPSSGQIGEAPFPEPPPIPEEVLKRFPSLRAWQDQVKDWLKQFVTAIKK